MVQVAYDTMTDYIGLYSSGGEWLMNEFLVQECGLTLVEICADIVAYFKIQGLQASMADFDAVIRDILLEKYLELNAFDAMMNNV